MTVMAAVPARSAAWMRLLVALTAARPDWLAWKGVGSALTGDGDIDSAAPAEAWPTIVDTFVDWAAGEGFAPVIVCPHAPGLLHIVTLAPGDEVLYELDVNRRKVFLGATLFRPADLLPLALMDAGGYRRLRPGAEGLLKLVQNGMARGGRVRWEGIARKGIRELLVADPDGVRAAARFFGRPRRRPCGGHARWPTAAGTGARCWRWRAGASPVPSSSRDRSCGASGSVAAAAGARCCGRSCAAAGGCRWRAVRPGWLRSGATRPIASSTHGRRGPVLTSLPEDATAGGVPARGRWLVVAGPDGVGKTTLAHALLEALGPAQTLHVHHRFGVLPRSAASRRPTTEPHAMPPYPRWLAGLKVGYLYLDHVVGWLTRVLPARRRGQWVVHERGWLDIAVDPRRYRLEGVGGLVSLLTRVAPGPDLTLVLDAPAAVMHARAPELGLEELERQRAAWRTVAPRHGPTRWLEFARARRAARGGSPCRVRPRPGPGRPSGHGCHRSAGRAGSSPYGRRGSPWQPSPSTSR